MYRGKDQTIIGVFILLCSCSAIFAQKNTATLPNVFLMDARQLQEVKRSVTSGEKRYDTAVTKVEADARKALSEGPFSVVTKTAAPPSGDKHDYMSQAPYFWADPKSPNGLPYIRRDGERNPEINKYPDHKSLDQLENAVETLSLAY